jgi:enoyl-CoA hydratase
VSEPVLLVDVTDRVATLTLNRPERRNALNAALTNALWDAVQEAGEDDDVDVVLVTGSDPAFCAGVDLTEMAGEVPTSARPVPRRGPDGLYRFLPLIDKPVIGAINGPCVTGGLELALQCTFLVASERARFADTHARVGVMPGGGMTALLPRAVGLRRAIEMSLTGNHVPAAEALQMGLVNHVVPHDELLPFTRQLAADLVSCDQTAVRRLLDQYRRVAAAGSLAEAHALEGLMAETWRLDPAAVAARRQQLTARGREQGLR